MVASSVILSVERRVLLRAEQMEQLTAAPMAVPQVERSVSTSAGSSAPQLVDWKVCWMAAGTVDLWVALKVVPLDVTWAVQLVDLMVATLVTHSAELSVFPTVALTVDYWVC